MTHLSDKAKKPLRCKLGLHKWFLHNFYCHWFLFNVDATCLRCGKYEYEYLKDIMLNTVGNIQTARMLQYGPDATPTTASLRLKAKKKDWFIEIYVYGDGLRGVL